VSKNSDGVTIDVMAYMLLRDTAVCEVKQPMGAIPPEDLTGVEILAVLAILRGAKERVDAQQRPPASSRLTCCWDRPGLSSGRSERCSQVLLPGLLQTDLCATREDRIVHREHPTIGRARRHVKRHHGLNAVAGVDVHAH
jgi:hypothetical protein